jgi:hypothetical protein
MLRSCYLSIVQIGRGHRAAGASNKERSYEMSILMNRILDVVVTYAVLGLTLTVAGATAFLGA